MGLCLPWRTLFQAHSGKQRVRLLTCNVHLHRVTDLVLADLISEDQPEPLDIVVFQEFPQGRAVSFLPNPQWHYRHDGELLVASRYPIRQSEHLADEKWTVGGGPGGSAMRYDIETPRGMIHLVNLHPASPHNPFRVGDRRGKNPGIRMNVARHLAIRTEQSRNAQPPWPILVVRHL